MPRSTVSRVTLVAVGLAGVLVAAAATLTQPADVEFDEAENAAASTNVTATDNSVAVTSPTGIVGGFYRTATGTFEALPTAGELDKDTEGAWTGTDARFDVALSAGFTRDSIFRPGKVRLSNGREYRTGPYTDPSGPTVATLASGTVQTPVADLNRIQFLTGPSLGTDPEIYTITFIFDDGGSGTTSVVRHATIEPDTVTGGARNTGSGGDVHIAPSGVVSGELLDEVFVNIPDPGVADLISIAITYIDTELAGPLAVSHRLPDTEYNTAYSSYEGTYVTLDTALPAAAALPVDGTAFWYGFSWDETVTTGTGPTTETLGDITLTVECGDTAGGFTEAGVFSSADGDDPTVVNLLTNNGTGACVGRTARYTADFVVHLDESPTLDGVTFKYDIDADGDGIGAAGYRADGTVGAVDCDDTDDTIYPGAPDACGDNVDSNCDGVGDSDDDDEDGDDLTVTQENAASSDPCVTDTDGDGIDDGDEVNTTGTLANDGDSDDDGLSDSAEDANKNGTLDTGETDPNAHDTDGDGLPDGLERGITMATRVLSGVTANGVPFGGTDTSLPDRFRADVQPATTTNPRSPDDDGDGLCDGAIAVSTTCVAGEDINRNGRVDATETDPKDTDSDDDLASDRVEHVVALTDPRDDDSDNDGLLDGAEITGPTDPLDADSDNDGLKDGEESNTSPTNPDSDGDGLNDGLERGRNTPISGGVSGARGHTFTGTAAGWVPDSDTGSQTLPNNPDSDGDGLCDGNIAVSSTCVAAEDANRNGRVDATETDPRDTDSDDDGADDRVEHVVALTDPRDDDSDNDGLMDGVEISGPTNPLDADTDNDGLKDGEENNSNPILLDTDGDGLNDGLERGRNTPVPAGTSGARDIPFTGTAAGWIPDSHTSSQTFPNDPDSDDDGLCDGNIAVSTTCVAGEDTDGNGRVNGSETNPRDSDTDDDGSNDGAERTRNTDPLDADTDNDGLLDGAETASQAKDADRDDDGIRDGDEAGLGTDVNVADTDGDGLSDGLELGRFARVPGGTSSGRNIAFTGTAASFVGDTHPDSVTLPNDPDTDNDGLCDGPSSVGSTCTGGEDRNANGAVDGAGTFAETDPLRGDTDGDTLADGNEQLVLGTDPLELDTDRDGVNDNVEATASTNPLDADSDDDGLSDGEERQNPLNTLPTNRDTDGDGLTDGLEVGRTSGIPAGASNTRGIVYAGTATSWRPDTQGSTRTLPLNPDSDGDGLCDGPNTVGSTCIGGEDMNADGSVNQSGASRETDPNDSDSDDDSASDGNEVRVRFSDPLDPDTDNDGLLDGDESVTNVLDADSDDDGLSDFEERASGGVGTTPNNPDFDNDGLNDGLELGRSTPIASGTSSPRGIAFAGTATTWQRDLDTSTTTLPRNADSDSDQRSDGIEDLNHNGRIDAGETNPNNPDTDGDGLMDGVEDANDDGVTQSTETNPLLADTDSDGLSDGAEDANGDRIVQPTETSPLLADTDADRLTDGEEVLTTLTNPRSTDSDGDGARDAYEIGVTSNVPGAVRAPNTPIPMPLLDTDEDGTIDALDTDDDNDSIPTASERVGSSRVDELDTDQDGVPNFRDDDDDNDDALTIIELANDTDPLLRDTDGDSLIDGWEFGPDPWNPLDTDGDLVIDALDTDDDNDNIPTIDEVVEIGIADGRLNAAELALNDREACGFPTDGLPCHLDIDCDGDGICDGDHPGLSGVCTPGGSTVRPGGDIQRETRIDDLDEDGIPNLFDCNDEDGCDGDGDGDGFANCDERSVCVDEALAGVQCGDPLPGDTDGMCCMSPSNPDTDGDGIPDNVEVQDINNPQDTDGDGIPDVLDDDDDGDSVLTRREDYDSPGVGVCADFDGGEVSGDGDPQNDDTDRDGIADYLDTDDDGDGVLTIIEAHDPGTDPCAPEWDFDGDGVPDYLDDIDDGPDGDNDGDGITNGEELALGMNPDTVDSDGDGVPDDIEIGSIANPIDSDGDTIIDALDPDDDDDGISTDDEGAFDMDGDGVPNYLDDDSDGDGILDMNEPLGDSDGDGAPDFLDAVDDVFGAIPDDTGANVPVTEAGGCDASGGAPLWLALLPLGLLVRRRSVRASA